MGTRLSAEEISGLDPYQLMAALGKRVVHPGGAASTEDMLSRADLGRGMRVLEVGCGPGTTAVDVARRFGAHVTAVDFDPRMVARAERLVARAGLRDVVDVQEADAHELPFPSESFDRVLIEAGSAFTTRDPDVSHR